MNGKRGHQPENDRCRSFRCAVDLAKKNFRNLFELNRSHVRFNTELFTSTAEALNALHLRFSPQFLELFCGIRDGVSQGPHKNKTLRTSSFFFHEPGTYVYSKKWILILVLVSSLSLIYRIEIYYHKGILRTKQDRALISPPELRTFS